MLENSIWRQYNDTLDIYSALEALYAKWDMELEKDNVKLHNILKAKLTKKEFRLFAMLNANVEEEKIKERFGYDTQAFIAAKEKLYKKLKQDKVRLALQKKSRE